MIDQFLHFIVHHWVLWSLFGAILILLIWQELRTKVGGVTQLSPQEVVEFINHKKATVIDIRPNTNYTKGHIIGAINLPADKLDEKNLDKYRKNPIIIVCDIGQQSLKEAIKLRKLNIADLYTLRGGLTAWKNANLPLEAQ